MSPLHRLDQFKDDISDEEDLDAAEEDLFLGVETLMRVLVDCLPFPRHYDANAEKESFVLAPPDFGSQNLLCDADGNITAVLDWDTLDTRPRAIGWCMPPDWLYMDWWGEDRYCWSNGVSSPCELEKYRRDYAGFLGEACAGKNGDWKFTGRSAMFERIVDAISRRDEEAMISVLTAVVGLYLPRVDLVEVVRQVGGEEGGEMGEEMTAFSVRGFEMVFGTEGRGELADEEMERDS